MSLSLQGNIAAKKLKRLSLKMKKQYLKMGYDYEANNEIFEDIEKAFQEIYFGDAHLYLSSDKKTSGLYNMFINMENTIDKLSGLVEKFKGIGFFNAMFMPPHLHDCVILLILIFNAIRSRRMISLKGIDCEDVSIMQITDKMENLFLKCDIHPSLFGQ